MTPITTSAVGVRPIIGFEDYFAGSDGNIYSTRVGKTFKKLKGALDGKGRYLFVVLRSNNQSFPKNVHRLICHAWLGPPPCGCVASHINGNPIDNRPENLTWETQSKNLSRRKEHGTMDSGTANSRSPFSASDIVRIRALYSSGHKQREIAGIFGVTQQTISRIVRGDRYE